MNSKELKIIMRRLRAGYKRMRVSERIEITRLLVDTALYCVDGLRGELREGDTTANRRKAKGRETETDPKPPVKPVRIAEPSKPKKPKYSGNHAPSARR